MDNPLECRHTKVERTVNEDRHLNSKPTSTISIPFEQMNQTQF